MLPVLIEPFLLDEFRPLELPRLDELVSAVGAPAVDALKLVPLAWPCVPVVAVPLV